MTHQELVDTAAHAVNTRFMDSDAAVLHETYYENGTYKATIYEIQVIYGRKERRPIYTVTVRNGTVFTDEFPISNINQSPADILGKKP